MFIKCQNIFLSGSSIAYRYLTEAKTESVGKDNPIDLPSVDIDVIKKTIGKKITHGDVGSIYQVNDCTPPRVYKVISQDQFKDGNEIRISKIAGDIGVAPTFYSAFLVNQQSEKYVVIEMEDADKSLGKWMEKLAESAEIEVKGEKEEEPLTEKEKAMREMIKKIQAEMEMKYEFVLTEVVQKKKLSLEEAVNKLYKNQEAFYYELFSKIKILAENNIAFKDSHAGNIMPNHGTEKGLQLIDFDAAKLLSDTKSAASEAIQSIYNRVHFNKFKELSNLSNQSVELIGWFANTQNFD